MISVPMKIVPSVIKECAEKGIMGAVVISAGRKEAGEAGREMEEEIVREAGRVGMRIIGPNCLGVVKELLLCSKGRLVYFADTFHPLNM